uniref:ubiquitinyl hydrolase 1 n=1 Tax=Oryctolagus cuniculus TaxID=9986 RepID=A0A5F9D5K4_RABIT
MESIFQGSLCQPSGNMGDSGLFFFSLSLSIQVISNALTVWGLEQILFNSPEYQRLRSDSINERSFICNYKEHWFTVRKLGKQWFNLNSLARPSIHIRYTPSLFLAQLQQEGYPIFVIKDDLPA